MSTDSTSNNSSDPTCDHLYVGQSETYVASPLNESTIDMVNNIYRQDIWTASVLSTS
jgi:hypothetical protein